MRVQAYLWLIEDNFPREKAVLLPTNEKVKQHEEEL